MENDKFAELARDAGINTMNFEVGLSIRQPELMAFAAAIRAASLEEAARCCEDEPVAVASRKGLAAAIRALKCA